MLNVKNSDVISVTSFIFFILIWISLKGKHLQSTIIFSLSLPSLLTWRLWPLKLNASHKLKVKLKKKVKCFVLNCQMKYYPTYPFPPALHSQFMTHRALKHSPHTEKMSMGKPSIQTSSMFSQHTGWSRWMEEVKTVSGLPSRSSVSGFALDILQYRIQRYLYRSPNSSS